MAVLAQMVEQLGRKVQPKDEFYIFSEQELESEILEAMVFVDPELESLENLTKMQEVMVLYKAYSSCFYWLASKHAENIRFRIENDEYHGNQPHHAYLTLARKYEQLFDGLSGGNSIQVNTVTRTQTGTGRKAPYYQGDTP